LLSLVKDYKTYLNNNWLIVQVSALTNVKDALDVGQKMLMTMLKIKVLPKLQNIHMLPDKEHAKLLLVNTKLKAMIWLKLVMLNN